MEIEAEIRTILARKHELESQAYEHQIETEYKLYEDNIHTTAQALGFTDDIEVLQVSYHHSKRAVVMPKVPEEFQRVIDAVKRGESVSGDIPMSDLTDAIGYEWFGDEVVNAFVSLLQSKVIGVLNSFFFTKLSDTWKLKGNEINYNNTKRWATKINFFSYEKVLIPINIKNTHWVLGVINNIDKTVSVLDSLSYPMQEIAEKILTFVTRFGEENGRVSNYQIVTTDVPKQKNGRDCGAFTCKFADCISLDAEFEFTQDDIQNWRSMVVAQIVLKKLIVPR
ncbi:sentrin/sumo-specific protease, putative [Entamoeba invadens IP1]|uniref:sentrin/sumo-specific protease, putative n=1 Tax=Entamoeba invadens IP1 TaxID=370355 RepID=UPI0002C3D023|nr:sentrin/sumo-specific protease, putative [Entamoeba invadens IP1]ELP90552.1 sentrin/sumo-specific protease, putative [Entamoeba invadens IP1]|eukprot:XP_004257323.1 sentrin/sumo-specific protease, putative [Entamoeba invadens IP1]